jgi:hypothetical protein
MSGLQQRGARMTHPVIGDVEAVAPSLTKAQREAVERAYSSPFDKHPRVAATGATRKALRDRGLGHGDWCYLTPLGLAVREHLLAGSDKGVG